MTSDFSNSNFLILSNSIAGLEAINAVPGAYQDLALADGEKTKRYLYCRYGTYPQQVPGKGTIQQVLDKEAGEQLAANFRQFAGLDAFFKGVPHFEGHPDDPGWLAQNPGHKAIAVGRIKSLEAGEDGIYATSIFNADGVKLLSGEAPPYSGHSPRWKCVPIPGRKDHYRPVLLMSDGLTNNPNIPGSTLALNTAPTPSPDAPEQTGDQPENPTTMKLTPEALKALGFAPDATPTEAEISAAIVKLLGEKQTAEADKVTAVTDATTANTRATALQTQITAAIEIVANDAVKTGRITAAEKPQWVTALNTDFPAESTKLQAKMPVINTQNQLPDLGGRRDLNPADAPSAIEAMNSAVAAFAKEHSLDLSNAADHAKAWSGAQAAKPELFKRSSK